MEEERLAQLTYVEAEEVADWLVNSCTNWSYPGIVIMRGIPGTGKSTFAHDLVECLARREHTAAIVSADNFFTRNNVYHYNRYRLDEAHAVCRRDFRNEAAGGTHVVIVDNTNVTLDEWQYYELYAQENNLIYCFVNMHVRTHHEALVCLRRSGRRIDGMQQITRMNRYATQHTHPSFTVHVAEHL